MDSPGSSKKRQRESPTGTIARETGTEEHESQLPQQTAPLSQKLDLLIQKVDRLTTSTNDQVAELHKVTTSTNNQVAETNNEVARLRESTNHGLREVTAKLDLLVECNPSALVREINPAIVASRDQVANASRDGSITTWTVTQRTDSETFLALTAKHCGLFKRTVRPENDISFVEIPQLIIDAGILRIGYVGEPSSNHNKDDFLCVEVNSRPRVDGQILTYEPAPNELISSRFVGGQGVACSVRGENASRRDGDCFYFVEHASEDGTSGTLMFNEHKKMLGVFVSSVSRSGLLDRGIIAPLPDITNIQWVSQSDVLFERVELSSRLRPTRRVKQYTVQTRTTESGHRYQELSRNEKFFTGVFVNQYFAYAGGRGHRRPTSHLNGSSNGRRTTRRLCFF